MPPQWRAMVWTAVSRRLTSKPFQARALGCRLAKQLRQGRQHHARWFMRHASSAASAVPIAHIVLNGQPVQLGPQALAGASILDACAEAGHSLPHECRQGTCGLCEVEVRLGSEAGEEVGGAEAFRVLACREPVAPGMLVKTLHQPPEGARSSTARLKDPDASADLCIERLQHKIDGLPGEPPSAPYLPAKLVDGLLESVPMKKWIQLLEGKEAVILDGLGLDDFGALVVARLCRRASDGAAGSQGGMVRSLSLNGNPAIGPAGAGHLARTLLVAGHPLRSLFLTDCGLGDEGAAAVADAVHWSETLMILEMRKNSITETGASALARALRKNGSLTNMYLSKNNINDDGAMLLSRAILWRPERAPKVKLWLQDNPISEPTREQISRVLGKTTVKW